MKLNKNNITKTMEAPGMIMRADSNFGEMTVCFHELPQGVDFTPMLEGLVNDRCHCPHWGYMIEGELLVKYDDGTEETLITGDVFYMRPGHTAIVKKNSKHIEFSPTKEFNEVMEHVASKM